MSTLPPLKLSIDVESEEQRILLMHAISAAVRRIRSPDGKDPAEKYMGPEFTQKLLEHMHKAKIKALEMLERTPVFPMNEGMPMETQSERFARYHTPEFTQQLTEHLHAAKQAALTDAMESDTPTILASFPPSSPR